MIKKSLPSIGVIGPGAIGCVVAARLEDLGLPVTLVGRNGPWRQTVQIQTHGEWRPYRFGNHETFDVILLCVKSYQIRQAIQQHAHLLAAGEQAPSLLVLANGWRDATEITAVLPAESVALYQGMTTYAVRRHEADRWEWLNPDTGQVIWGGEAPLSASMRVFCELTGGHGFEFKQDTAYDRRLKWLYNTCLNGLCGKYLLAANGLARQHLDELQSLLEEAYHLGEELWGPWRESSADMFSRLCELVATTAGNENSMVADLKSGRPTEIADMAGLVFRAHGHYPQLTELTRLIRRREAAALDAHPGL
jgi:2-dehydropantoate 2-reductase